MTGRFEQALSSPRAVPLVIALAMAVATTSIAIGYLTDDHAFRAMLHSTTGRAPPAYDLFRFESGNPDANLLRIRYGHLAWWAAPDLKIHFLRPLTSLVFAADDAVLGTPLGGHLVSLALLLALLVAAAAWFRQILPAPAATLALAVFGLAASHVEAYAWISARHIVIAAAFAATALALRATRPILAVVVLAIGLTASEATLAVLPLYLATTLSTPSPRRARLLACLPPLVLGLAYLALYAALGFGTRGSGGYHDPASDPITFLGLVALRVPILLGDAALGIPAELAHVISEPLLALLGLAATAFVALAAGQTSARSLRLLALAGIAATTLGAAGFPAGRMLVIPDLAFAPLLGLIIFRGLSGPRGRVLAILLLAVHLVLAPLATLASIHRLAARATTTTAIADDLRRLAPPSGRVYLIAASDPMVYLYPRGILADTSPATLRCWTTFSGARAGHRLTRTGPKSFTLEPIERPLLDHSFDTLFRSPDRPFAVGDTIDQCGATITIAAVLHGLPSRLSITLRRNLDDPELAFLVWRDHHLERFTFPALDSPIELPWSSGPSNVL